MERRLRASPDKVLTIEVPSAGRAELGTALHAQPPSGEEGSVTVGQGPEGLEGEGRDQRVTGSSQPQASWRGCPASLGERPQR